VAKVMKRKTIDKKKTNFLKEEVKTEEMKKEN